MSTMTGWKKARTIALIHDKKTSSAATIALPTLTMVAAARASNCPPISAASRAKCATKLAAATTAVKTTLTSEPMAPAIVVTIELTALTKSPQRPLDGGVGGGYVLWGEL